MSVVHPSPGSLSPASPALRSEVSVVCGLAQALWPDDELVPWGSYAEDYRLIREQIAEVVPGFERFEERLRDEGDFTLHHPVRDDQAFPTATGRARLTVNPLEVVSVPPGRLLLQTLRSHDQFNTTIYGLHDRYRGIANARRVVMVHPDDLEELGFADGDVVDLVSEHRATGRSDGGAAQGDGEMSERVAPAFRVVAYPTARGCAAAYFPETNVLVALDSTAIGSNTPASKSVVIRLARPG
jgi:anaerobic selenocysteine-containing dehydrogenase